MHGCRVLAEGRYTMTNATNNTATQTPSSYQQAVYDFITNGTGHGIVLARAGSGKCLGRGTPVLRFDGSIVPVESVRTGDVLMGPDSLPRTVQSVSTGTGPLFRITPTKGDSWVCNDVHVMTLSGTNRENGRVRDVPLNELIDESVFADKRIDRDWKLFRAAVEFPAQTVSIDPYLVGLWLGDGTRGEAQITNCEPIIRQYCQDIAATYGHECVLREDTANNTWNIRFRIGERGMAGPHTPSILRRFFKACEVDGYKVLPKEYMINDRATRLAVLAGMLDTDGYVSTGSYEWVSVSHTLAEQMLFLARSLGFTAYVSDKIVDGIIYKRVLLSGDLHIIPNLVPRRKSSVRKQTKRVTHTGFTAMPIGIGEFFGFTLDGDGRFLLGDFTVTHNTTTIVNACKLCPLTARVLFVAFNKSIAEELQRRVPGNTTASTLHSFGFRACKAAGFARVDKDKERNIAIAILPRDTTLALVASLCKLVSMCKAWLVDDEAGINDLAEAYECTGNGTIATPEWARYAQHVLAQSKVIRSVSFDDMVWLPIALNLRIAAHDVVFVDETQDLNRAQMELVVRAAGERGRVVAVGDDRQAIYAFRGADSASIERLTERLSATVMPLSITYRCPRAVVAEAQRYVPDITAADSAAEGTVNQGVTEAKMLADAKPGDAILSRTNAPLVRTCLALLRAGKRAAVRGREIGQGLATLVRKSKCVTIVEFAAWLATYEQREVARLQAAGKDSKAEEVTDKVATLNALSDGCATTQELCSRIESLFRDDDDDNRVLLSSTHKAKGLEWCTVWMLSDTYRAARSKEEANLAYVAVTRARATLNYVVGVK